jgi:lipoate-protein ligase A
MSLDQSLLDRAESAGESWLRLYQWAPHCLSFGRHEPAARRYDRSRIAALGLDVVRRPTGGRAVWHARELTYAVAAPSRLFGGPRDAYLEIHRMLLAALRRLGVEAELAQLARAAPLDAGACFAHAAGGEIMVKGRKVVGSAQLRQGSALLQHGSILLADDQDVVRQVTRTSSPEGPNFPCCHAVDPSVALLPRDDNVGCLSQAIADAAASAWPGAWETSHSADELLHEAARHAHRFRSDAWTWGA